MIFRQLFDPVSSTYTYLLGSRKGGEALIIDPVLDRVDLYLRLIEELELELVKAVDTHVHADHITGLGALRDHTHCITVMGEQSGVDVVSMRVGDGDQVSIEGGISLDALYTPGHTDDSYCFLMADRVFSGDTLLIRGTGRTDFQNGNPEAQYDSIFGRLLKLPDSTFVYPAHDYKGETVSTIAEERSYNPRLQVSSKQEYVDIMNALDLADPKMMDVAVPANLRIGLSQAEVARRGWNITAERLDDLRQQQTPLLIDLREDEERRRNGVIAGSLHLPYNDLDEALEPDGMLSQLARSTGRRPIFYCAFGERSAMAVEMARDAGLAASVHLEGGIDAWKKDGGAVEKVDS